MLLATFVLKKGVPGRNVITGVLMMSVGCVIAATGDMAFDLKAYAFGKSDNGLNKWSDLVIAAAATETY